MIATILSYTSASNTATIQFDDGTIQNVPVLMDFSSMVGQQGIYENGVLVMPPQGSTTPPPTTTALNDFQVGDGAGAWIKKTLAETITILRTSLDSIYAAIGHNHTGTYAPAANGVTNGDSHDHNGGDGAQIDHVNLANKGTNTHAQIDTHIAAVAGSSAHNMREVLTGNRTYYVRTDGSDSNTGLIDSAGGAFKTIQKAWTSIAALDLSVYVATIQVRSGTHTGGLVITQCPVGSSIVNIIGDETTPSNVLWSVAGTAALIATNCNIKIAGFKIATTSGGHGIYTNHPAANVQLGKNEYGVIAGDQIRVDGGKIKIVADYSISGGAVRHILTGLKGVVEMGTQTVTLTGTPAFSGAFAQAIDSTISLYVPVYSGSATGKRYDASLNGVINTFTAVTLPGNSAGTATTGGQFA